MYPKKTTVCWIQPPQTGRFHCERRIFVVSCGVAIRVSDGQNKGGSRNHSHPFCHWFLDTCPIPNPIPHVWSLHLSTLFYTMKFGMVEHLIKVQKVESHFFGASNIIQLFRSICLLHLSHSTHAPRGCKDGEELFKEPQTHRGVGIMTCSGGIGATFFAKKWGDFEAVI